MLQEISYLKYIHKNVHTSSYSPYILLKSLFMTPYPTNTLVYSERLAEQKLLKDFFFFSRKRGLYSNEDKHEFSLIYTLDIQFPFFFLRYDPKTDTWTMVAPLSMPRDAVGVCLLGDKLYAVGGYDGQTYLNTMEAYDPQTNEWTQVIIKSLFFSSVTYFNSCT